MKGALTKTSIFEIPNANIIHICNIAGGFGKGFAGQIAEKFPAVKAAYKFLHNEGRLELGTRSTHYEESDILITNMYAMSDYRRGVNDNRVLLDYEALATCLEGVCKHIQHTKRLVVLPYGMGAGNAGGSWAEVVRLLDKHLPFYVVCKKPEEEI